MSDEKLSIRLEFTPNPNTLKFVLNRTLVERGAVNFESAAKAAKCPLAQAVFRVPGITAVMLGNKFVTITKGIEGSWDVVADEVPKAIENHLNQGGLVFDPDYSFEQPQTVTGESAEIEKKIMEILDNEIRPAVAMDGGDITLSRYDDGIVYLHLQGACNSCPSSTATLQMGVATRLKEAIPEIKEVVQV